MRRNLSALLIVVLLAAGRALGSGADDLPADRADEEVLKNAGLSTDSKSILDFFRRRTLTGTDQNKVVLLIRQLGDDSFQSRATASTDLIGLGVAAIPYLRQALKGSDPEVVRRSEECLRVIEEKSVRVAIPVAAAHLLASRKPVGASEVLLGFLPFADDDTVVDEVKIALAAIAVQNGKPDKMILSALKDTLPQRRAAVGEILSRANSGEYRALVKGLLTDSDLSVRLRAAMALADASDKDAVPVLIDLLARLPGAQATPAEDLLLRLADDRAPLVGLGNDDSAHHKCREAWAAWWHEQRDHVDLAKLHEKTPWRGFTLVVLLEKGRVLELDPSNNARFQIDGLKMPLDAQMLPGDRVLIAEQQADRVTERNRNGDILWEKKVPSPLVAQRLLNGHTFIASQFNLQNPNVPQLVEVDREGKECFAFTFPQGEMVMKASRLPNGDIACVTNLHRFVRLDNTGKELKTYQVLIGTIGGRLDVLANGNAVVPEKDNDRVVEYDSGGRIAWQIPFPRPIAASRLPNGNTLVTSFVEATEDRPSRAVEVDRSGNEVWSYESDTRVTRAFRR